MEDMKGPAKVEVLFFSAFSVASLRNKKQSI